MPEAFLIQVMIGGTLAGAGTGMLGAYVVGMRVPFIGICIAHSALAGAVAGSLLGWPVVPAALAGAVLAAVLLGAVDPERTRINTNMMMSVLLSLTMGLAFLGIATTGAARNDLLALMWGSVLLCTGPELWLMAGVTAAEVAFVVLFHKELRAILFSRTHAAAAGVPAAAVWTMLLVLTGVVLTVHFEVVGGLMIYALLTNPAIAAFQLTRGYGRSVLASAGLGGLSGFGGFLLSYATDLPTGAVIVIVSSILVGVCGLLGHWRRRRGPPPPASAVASGPAEAQDGP